jgi:Spherulation-specific family 4/Fibronectin type III domain
MSHVLPAAPMPTRPVGRVGLRTLTLLLAAALLAVLPAGMAQAASLPGAPTGVVGVAGDTSVTVSWVAPASGGGSQLTGYRVRYSTNGGSSWSSTISTGSTQPTFVVTRLRNGRAYVFQVRAANRSGSGPWSVTSAPVTPSAAPAPPPPPPTPPPSTAQHLAVPSYFYPGAFWSQLGAGAPTVGLAVVNPSSGPGTAPDPNYVSQVSQTRARGITVVGYVDTAYGSRALSAVEADVDRQYQWYGVDGIFFDEVPNECSNISYYQALADYVRAKPGTHEVVLNPGASTGECFMSASDVLITFEDTYAQYVGWHLSGWETKYPATRFWQLIIGASQTDLPNAIALSRSRNVGWIYVTPDTLPNPWDTLPDSGYWNQELSAAAA